MQVLLPIILSALALAPLGPAAGLESGFLGVYLGSDSDPAVVNGVVPGSPAAEAGLQAGDAIVAFGDEAIATTGELRARLNATSAGKTVRLTIRRGEATEIMQVTLASRATPPQPAPAVPPVPPRKPGARTLQLQPPAAEAPAAGVPGLVVLAERPFLGVYLGAEDDGVAIDGVVENSPAEKAKLQSGDIIIRIDDNAVASSDDLMQALSQKKPGDKVTVLVRREGEEKKFRVKLDKRGVEAEGGIVVVPELAFPPAEIPEVIVPEVRVRGIEIPAQPAKPALLLEEEDEGENPFLGVYLENAEKGALIQEVIDGTPAAKAGLQSGDIVVSIDKDKVASADDLVAGVAARKPGQKVALKVLRNDEPMRIGVVLGTREEEEEEEESLEAEEHEEDDEEADEDEDEVHVFKVRPGAKGEGGMELQLKALKDQEGALKLHIQEIEKARQKANEQAEKARGMAEKVKQKAMKLRVLEKQEGKAFVLEDDVQVIDIPCGKVIIKKSGDGLGCEITIEAEGETKHIVVPVKPKGKAPAARRMIVAKPVAPPMTCPHCQGPCKGGKAKQPNDSRCKGCQAKKWTEGEKKFRILMKKHGGGFSLQGPTFQWQGRGMRPGFRGMYTPHTQAQPMAPSPHAGGIWIWVPGTVMGAPQGGHGATCDVFCQPGMGMMFGAGCDGDCGKCCGSCGAGDDEDEDDDSEDDEDEDDDEGEECEVELELDCCDLPGDFKAWRGLGTAPGKMMIVVEGEESPMIWTGEEGLEGGLEGLGTFEFEIDDPEFELECDELELEELDLDDGGEGCGSCGSGEENDGEVNFFQIFQEGNVPLEFNAVPLKAIVPRFVPAKPGAPNRVAPKGGESRFVMQEVSTPPLRG
ncbi:MAG: PDZ domain-containing protein [Planctomycetota bacterium]